MKTKTSFKKGHKGYWLDKERSLETKKKISEKMKAVRSKQKTQEVTRQPKNMKEPTEINLPKNQKVDRWFVMYCFEQLKPWGTTKIKIGGIVYHRHDYFPPIAKQADTITKDISA